VCLFWVLKLCRCLQKVHTGTRGRSWPVMQLFVAVVLEEEHPSAR
jgi:hypothetical protein